MRRVRRHAKRTPLTKQRNKHCKPFWWRQPNGTPAQFDLAMVYEKEKMKGNQNRRPLAGRARWWRISAVDRGEREFVPLEQINRNAAA